MNFTQADWVGGLPPKKERTEKRRRKSVQDEKDWLRKLLTEMTQVLKSSRSSVQQLRSAVSLMESKNDRT